MVTAAKGNFLKKKKSKCVELCVIWQIAYAVLPIIFKATGPYPPI